MIVSHLKQGLDLNTAQGAIEACISPVGCCVSRLSFYLGEVLTEEGTQGPSLQAGFLHWVDVAHWVPSTGWVLRWHHGNFHTTKLVHVQNY